MNGYEKKKRMCVFGCMHITHPVKIRLVHSNNILLLFPLFSSLHFISLVRSSVCLFTRRSCPKCGTPWKSSPTRNLPFQLCSSACLLLIQENDATTRFSFSFLFLFQFKFFFTPNLQKEICKEPSKTLFHYLSKVQHVAMQKYGKWTQRITPTQQAGRQAGRQASNKFWAARMALLFFL